jgi:hypothetical protein
VIRSGGSVDQATTAKAGRSKAARDEAASAG